MSVLLLPPMEKTLGVTVTEEGTDDEGVALPVNSKRVKELTSMTCRDGTWLPAEVAFDVGTSLNE